MNIKTKIIIRKVQKTIKKILRTHHLNIFFPNCKKNEVYQNDLLFLA